MEKSSLLRHSSLIVYRLTFRNSKQVSPRRFCEKGHAFSSQTRPSEKRRNRVQSLLMRSRVFFLGTDRTNVCWIKEVCKTLAPKSCGSLPLDVVDYVEEFDGYLVNLHLNLGCLARNKVLDDELNNAPASCNLPCFHIKKTGKYCYMGTS